MSIMDSLGISDVGGILRGSNTTNGLSRSKYSQQPICPELNSKSQYNNSFGNKIEKNKHITNLYSTEELNVSSLDEYRYKEIQYGDEYDLMKNNKYLTNEQKKKAYFGEEDHIFCGRFPHLNYCGCNIPCSLILKDIHPVEILDNLFCGNIECAYKTKELLFLKIEYILNVSCIEYHKRKFFNYYDIYINDSSSENVIKFFKITNRIIDNVLSENKRILIHSENGKSRCYVFVMAYLIGRKGLKFNEAYERVKEKFKKAEPNDNFLTQLKHYDLEVNI